jgi:hypothetical protein
MNPNNALLNSNPAYKSGFEKKAAGKKMAEGFTALGAGVVGSVVALIKIVSIFSFN